MVSLGAGNSGDGAITYRPKVPDALTRIVVLDASWQVRELCSLDKGITLRPEHEHVKGHAALEVIQKIELGGRSSMEKLRRNSRVVKRYVEDILALPKGEAALTITYLTRGKRGPTEVLRDALEDAGVNLDEKVLVQVWNIPKQRMEWVEKLRFPFLHWGSERAVSKFSYCHNSFAMGVLRRDLLDLSSAVLAQTADHSSKLVSDRKFIREVQASEQFYVLQQFIGRGAAREIINGECKPAKVTVYDQTDFAPFLDHGLPGVRWSVTGKLKADPSGAGRKRGPKGARTKQLAAQIVEFLSTYSCESISVRDLKAQLGLSHVHNHTFQTARDLALASLPEWTMSGRSIQRAS